MVHYVNPKVIVGCLPAVGDKILLCKRAIEPRYGKWTLPAGFMENKESSAEGAARETWEEAAAKAINLDLYRIFDVPYISQVYLFYRCQIEDEGIWRGPRVPRNRFILGARDSVG
jgi:ADP-ribose pyrophosphatase YjhB (NUDIX family)